MTTKPDTVEGMGGEIEETEVKLRALEKEIEGIGGPACYSLRHRLKSLRIEENALQRNYAASQREEAKQDAAQMEKIETLLHHIEQEEFSLEHDAEFLHQASPTTLELAFEAGARLVERGAKRLSKIQVAHPRMWHSPFVNHTYKDLSTRFGLPGQERP